jgi:hypothetical protein
MGRSAARFDAKNCSNFAQKWLRDDGHLLPISNSDRTSQVSLSLAMAPNFTHRGGVVRDVQHDAID